MGVVMVRFRIPPFLFFVSFLFALPAYSVDYKFSGYLGIQWVSGKTSATAACSDQLMINACSGQYGSSTRASAFHHVERVTDTSYRCHYQLQTKKADGTWQNSTITSSCNGSQATSSRTGDSCPSGQSYNSALGQCEYPACPQGQTRDPSTGQCVPDNPCADKQGDTFSFSKSGTGSDDYVYIPPAGGPPPAAAQSACFSGCLVSTADQKCTFRVTGAYVCRGTGTYTGAECGSGSESPSDVESSTDTSEPEPQQHTDRQNCVYSTVGGKQVCTSTSSNENEGQYCGTVNGVKKCVDKPPTKNEDKIDTTVETVDNGDGTRTETKTDVHTNTKCTGVNSCTSTTTTVTTTTNYDASGNPTGSSSTCSGANCAPGGTGGESDGNGDGVDDCSKSSSCTGATSRGGKDLDDVPGFGDSLRAFLDSASDAPIVQGVTGIGQNIGSGNCHFGSANVAIIGNIDFDYICDHSDWLDPLYYIMLAVWALAAVRVLMSA